MIFYILALSWAYLLSIVSRRIPQWLMPLAIAPLVIFSAMRGGSGKDTPLYIARFESLDFNWAGLTFDSEPITPLLMLLARSIFGPHVEGYFVLQSGVVVMLYFLVAKKYAVSRLYVLTIGPVFLVDGITNALRITIAYHVLLLGYVNRQIILSSIIAVASHITATFPILFAWLSRMRRSASRILLLLFITVVVYGSLTFIDISTWLPRAMSKTVAYGDMVLPTRYSGVVDLGMLLMMFMLRAKYDSRSGVTAVLSIIAGLLMCVALYWGIQQSLAFIRITKVLIIALFVSGFLRRATYSAPAGMLVTAGILYSANFLRQVATDDGFLPYG